MTESPTLFSSFRGKGVAAVKTLPWCYLELPPTTLYNARIAGDSRDGHDKMTYTEHERVIGSGQTLTVDSPTKTGRSIHRGEKWVGAGGDFDFFRGE